MIKNFSSCDCCTCEPDQCNCGCDCKCHSMYTPVDIVYGDNGEIQGVDR